MSAEDGRKAEIEITPAMVAAGRDVIASRWMDFTGPHGALLWDEVMRGVFQAMLESRPK